jgi:hypothetical protein
MKKDSAKETLERIRGALEKAAGVVSSLVPGAVRRFLVSLKTG